MDFLSAFNSVDFFGKDSGFFFIGQIEDVNDPKLSGRVKVRIVGIHPKDKDGGDGISTDDLPWAHVIMPVTHAQQARIGGKHGLLPGCWVIGMNLDGKEAQMPVVLGSFNFVAKSTEENNKTEPIGKDGKLDPNDPTFRNFLVANKQFPNVGRLTPNEQGGLATEPNDPARNTILSEADATKCGGTKVLQSQQDKSRQDTFTKDNLSGQVKNILKADGSCGHVLNAKEDVKREIAERLPSFNDRFIFNDVVWNNTTGNFINLNGIINNLACILASILIQALMNRKGEEEEINRQLRRNINRLANDRDGFLIERIDDESQMKDDTFHALFAQTLIDILCSLLRDLLKELDDNNKIVNPAADCVSDTIIENVENILDEKIQQIRGGLSGIGGGIIDSVLSLGAFTAYEFIYSEKYTSRIPHNKTNDISQDVRNKTKRCNPARFFNTEIGSLPSIGFNFSLANKSNFNNPSIFNFGGASGSGGGTILCRDATTDSEEFVPPAFPIDQDLIPGNDDFVPNIPPINPNIPTIPGQPPVTEQPTPRPELPNNGGIGGGNNGGIGGGNNGGQFPTTPVEPIDPNNPPQTPNLPTEPIDIIQPPVDEVPVEGGVVITPNPNIPAETPPVDDGVSVPVTPPETPPQTPPVVVNPPVVVTPSPTPIVTPPVNNEPGSGGLILPVPLPVAVAGPCARNFEIGVPNALVILNPGRNYIYYDQILNRVKFPQIYIQNYDGVPIPVVDRNTGELVLVLTSCELFDEDDPSAPVTVIPPSASEGSDGIFSDSPQFDIQLNGFFIQNTGFRYCRPVITIIDRDTNEENGKVNVTVFDGRIVNVQVVNKGTGFRRIPEVIITDTGVECQGQTGFGAVIYPIMELVPRTSTAEDFIPAQDVIFKISPTLENGVFDQQGNKLSDIE